MANSNLSRTTRPENSQFSVKEPRQNWATPAFFPLPTTTTASGSDTGNVEDPGPFVTYLSPSSSMP